MGWKVLNNFVEAVFWFAIIVFIVYACTDNLPFTEKKCQEVEEPSK